MIYLDNAATSYPKPPAVFNAIDHCLREQGANPGRGGHRMAVSASRIIYGTRENLAKLFNVADSANIVFTLNTTDALNLALKGMLKPGDHVVTTMIEHNSMTRPLAWLEHRQGLRVTKVPCSSQGKIDLSDLAAAIRPETALVAVNHASNVIGNILPLADIAKAAHKNNVPLLVDAAQTAGCVPIDVEAMGIDLLAFAGHKALFGPQGTGGLYISPEIELMEFRQGGTGSESSGPQPLVRPDRYESGTPNTLGLAGLEAGVEFIMREGIEKIFAKESDLVSRLMAGLRQIQGLVVYGPPPGRERVPLISLNLEGFTPHLLAHMLDKAFDIASRAGLHCAPDAHRVMGTFETGALRLSLSYLNSERDVDAAIAAFQEIARDVSRKRA